MKKVIFVCHGNYHRSPLAHGLFQKLIEDNKFDEKLFCDSAGTACSHPGTQPHFKTLEILNRFNFNFEHRARLLNHKDLRDFDYILAMDHFNIRDILYIKKLTKNNKENIFLLRQFDPEIENAKFLKVSELLTSDKLDVPDPEVLKLQIYEEVFEMINRSVNNFFNLLNQGN